MNKIFRRFVAYLIDMFVIILITQSLSGIPVINKQLDTYREYYDEYIELVDLYGGFKSSLLSDFEDKKLSEKEYESLIEEYENYEEILSDSYDDQSLSEKEYDKINEEIDKDYQKKYKKLYYKIDQNSNFYFIIYLVVVFAYFTLFNKYTKGQTLGKKLTRLKIVSNKEEEEVPIWSYLVRTLILYQPISYLVRLICNGILSMNDYYTVTTIVSDIQYYLQMVIIVTIMLRMDGRGIHDLLAKTRVVSLDKQGNEIREVYPNYANKNVKEATLKKKSKKVIDASNE